MQDLIHECLAIKIELIDFLCNSINAKNNQNRNKTTNKVSYYCVIACARALRILEVCTRGKLANENENTIHCYAPNGIEK